MQRSACLGQIIFKLHANLDGAWPEALGGLVGYSKCFGLSADEAHRPVSKWRLKHKRACLDLGLTFKVFLFKPKGCACVDDYSASGLANLADHCRLCHLGGDYFGSFSGLKAQRGDAAEHRARV